MQFFILSSSCFNKLAWPSHEANLVCSQILEARDQPQPGFFLEKRENPGNEDGSRIQSCNKFTIVL